MSAKHSAKRKLVSSDGVSEPKGSAGRRASRRGGQDGAGAANDDAAKKTKQLDKEIKTTRELAVEQVQTESKLRECLVAYVGVSQEIASRVTSIEDSEKQRREAEEGFAKSKPLASTTLEERRQAAEISRLKLNLKTANDRACQLHVENSSLKDELKAQQTHFPSIDSDREVSQDDLKKLRRQLKTKEVLCTTVINELEAVRKELVDVTAKRDELSVELDLVSKNLEEHVQASQAELRSQLETLEADNRKLRGELWGDSGAKMSADGKVMTRKEMAEVNRQWEASYNKLKLQYNKLKVRTQENDGNPSHRRKKRSSKVSSAKGDDGAEEVPSSENSAKAGVADSPVGDSRISAIPTAAAAAAAAAASPDVKSAGTHVDDSTKRASQVTSNVPAPSPIPLKPTTPGLASSGRTDDSSHSRPTSSTGSAGLAAVAAVAASRQPATSGGTLKNLAGINQRLLSPGMPVESNSVSHLQREVAAGKLECRELRLQISKLQEALQHKRRELADEKEAHELTLAEKESLATALVSKDKSSANNLSSDESRLRQELHVSLKSEQRLQRELEASQQVNRQQGLQLEEVHKELLHLSNEKRGLERDLEETTARLSAINAALGQ